MISDARVLLQLLRGMPRNTDPAASLEAFYAPQAASYDRFRRRLLHGREELVRALPLGVGARLVELGAGTGSNLDLLADRLPGLARVDLVDLCPSLLARARARASGLPNVHIVAADAREFRPAAPADCVLFSYSLTMMSDWRPTLHNAVEMLRPGGVLAVVDFTLPAAGDTLARWFWKTWFGHDGVHLDDAHVMALRGLLPSYQLVVKQVPIPYLPGLQVPYFRYLGHKIG
jgi:S-adenosylmethionine-diacylgycerolhomoserine-N-methlytransferase